MAWDFGPDYDETRYAREVAAQFCTEHYEYRMTPADFLDFLPSYVWHMDEPVQEAAAISLFYLAKRAKQDVTVMLSGEGADEVFGGYPIYRYMTQLERYRLMPAWLRSGCGALASRCGRKWDQAARLSALPLEERYAGVSLDDMQQVRQIYTPATRRKVRGFELHRLVAPYYEHVRGADFQARMQYVDVKSWLVDDLLIKADRMSMAASIELRVPFLDHRLLEFAARMPSKYRMKRGRTKYLLKKAVERDLPAPHHLPAKAGISHAAGAVVQGPASHFRPRHSAFRTMQRQSAVRACGSPWIDR